MLNKDKFVEFTDSCIEFDGTEMDELLDIFEPFALFIAQVFDSDDDYYNFIDFD